MRLVGAVAVLVASCGGRAHEDEQSARDAIAIACSAVTTRDELARRITNREVTDVLARDEPPWELGRHIVEIAARESVTECHPSDAVAGIRARGGVDVPLLPDALGTFAPEHRPILAITPAGVARAHVEPGPVVIAADRSLAWFALAKQLDELQRAHFSFSQLLVTTPTEPRVVEVGAKAMPSDDKPIVTVALGGSIFVDGEEVAPTELRARVARKGEARVVVIVETTDVTLQRVVEAIAVAGGSASFVHPLPEVKRPQRP